MLQLGTIFLSLVVLVSSVPIIRKDDLKTWTQIAGGDIVFTLGNVSYLGQTSTPAATSDGTDFGEPVPFTVIKTIECDISSDVLQSILARYLDEDDVYSAEFLAGLYITSTCKSNPTIQLSAFEFIESTGCAKILVDPRIVATAGKVTFVAGLSDLEPGPYLAKLAGDEASLFFAYRLYQDRYRTFVFGAYPDISGQDLYKALPDVLTEYQDPLIPVPSRIYSWSDPRPFAGLRIGVKDLYDINGLQTAGGSRAWAEITPIASRTAPSIQRIVCPELEEISVFSNPSDRLILEAKSSANRRLRNLHLGQILGVGSTFR